MTEIERKEYEVWHPPLSEKPEGVITLSSRDNLILKYYYDYKKYDTHNKF